MNDKHDKNEPIEQKNSHATADDFLVGGKNDGGTVFSNAKNSHLLQIFIVGILILLLQLPVSMISGVVTERQTTRQEAVEEVTSKWGRNQSIIGPMLAVPYRYRVTELDEKGAKRIRIETRVATFLPDDLNVSSAIDCETRYRGIYKVPVYSIKLNVNGIFLSPDFSEWGIAVSDVVWDQAHLTLQISDARSITDQVAIQWDNKKLNFLPGSGDYIMSGTGIHVPMRGQLSQLTGKKHKFAFNMNLNGSESIFFAPLGKTTIVDVKSNWKDPSFQGNWLPSQRSINTAGFQAKWKIPFLGRNYPQKWRSDQSYGDLLSESLFGVEFGTPIDHYRMSDRSIKYALLFLTLTFAIMWLFQVLVKIRIHFIQYMLVGAGLCIFYLLELSLAEHIGFDLAYAGAAFSVMALVYFYCMYVLASYRRALVIAVALTVLYVYLYILLMNQDYALLIGSVGLFWVLAGIMYATRKVDWYSKNN
ncbi:MAG: cell envelope integrity protein CreD [Rubrobacteridae bacterium]|nr:cell envelope integrity protein CreD [Rubrobacteridae bacterium]